MVALNKRTKNHNDNISKAVKKFYQSHKHWNQGKHISIKAREKISNKLKGHKVLKVSRIKMSQSHKALKEKHPRWRGGRFKTRMGYVNVLCPDHPYAAKSGHVLEHRLVMEKYLGRVLLPTEVIHHINGIKDDNRIENLMLFSRSGDHARLHLKGKKRITK